MGETDLDLEGTRHGFANRLRLEFYILFVYRKGICVLCTYSYSRTMRIGVYCNSWSPRSPRLRRVHIRTMQRMCCHRLPAEPYLPMRTQSRCRATVASASTTYLIMHRNGYHQVDCYVARSTYSIPMAASLPGAAPNQGTSHKRKPRLSFEVRSSCLAGVSWIKLDWGGEVCIGLVYGAAEEKSKVRSTLYVGWTGNSNKSGRMDE